MPIELYSNPIFNYQYLKHELFFIMSMLETDTHLIFSGGINDNTNFVWEIGKEKLFKKIKL
jgi:hypothetical protein